jgi:hypothetical protein
MWCTLSNGNNTYKQAKKSRDVAAKMMAASYTGAGFIGGFKRELTVVSDFNIPDR